MTCVQCLHALNAWSVDNETGKLYKCGLHVSDYLPESLDRDEWFVVNNWLVGDIFRIKKEWRAL